jgi:hypothetical protein
MITAEVAELNRLKAEYKTLTGADPPTASNPAQIAGAATGEIYK